MATAKNRAIDELRRRRTRERKHEEIARAFFVREPTIAQRIVRAKRTLAEARVPFEVPRGRVSARSQRPRSWSSRRAVLRERANGCG